VSLRVPSTCESVDFCSTRITEAKKFGYLVEGLAGGIIEGSAKEFVFSESLNVEEKRVTAAHHQGDMWGDFRFAEKGREQVTLDVVDREKGFA
jgi:hypothetical protein